MLVLQSTALFYYSILFIESLMKSLGILYPGELLRDAYPDTYWHPWLFDENTATLWNDFESQREFFDWMQNVLGIKEVIPKY
jgi:hypothetical protein